MAVLAVLNPKGGTGKTTIAVNVGGCLHKRGHKVLIVDSDPQGTARDWYAAQPDDIGLPSVIGIDRPTLHKNVRSMTEDYDYIVIDGAARLEKIAVSAVRAADMVIIPLRHSGFDLWAIEALVETIQVRQMATQGIPRAAFVISSQVQGTRLARSMEEALTPFDFPVLASRTTQRVAYATAGGLGVTVLDLDGADKAAAEITALTTELQELINAQV